MNFADITSQEAIAFSLPDPERTRDEVVGLLQALIRTACVNFGDRKCEEERNIAVLEHYFKGKGIDTRRYARLEKPRRPNLIATVGSGKPRLMLGPSHVDVVPVAGHAESGSATGSSSAPSWTFDPFGGELRDGTVCGRGAVDMLGVVAAQAVAFAAIATSPARLLLQRGTLTFCAVSDEEASGGDGAGYIASDPTLRHIFRADFCLTEVGGATIPGRNGKTSRRYVQATSEKGHGEVTVRCIGRSGHGAVPENADNALTTAARVVTAINGYLPPTVILPEWRQFIEAAGVPWMARVLLTTRPLVAFALRLLRWIKNPLYPAAHASTRMTMTANHITGTAKMNVVPGHTEVHIDVRTLPGQDEAYVVQQIRRALGTRVANDAARYKVKVTSFSPATRSPADDGGRGAALWAALAAAAAAIVPGATVVPMCLMGSTDCRYFRDMGAVAFGANLLAPEITIPDLMARFHGADERICVRSLWTSVQFYSLIVKHMLYAAPQDKVV